MITEKQLKEIKKYLKEAENPLFFFDDDPDGLCGYLLLKKFLDKGKGVVIKGSPELDSTYLRKIKEYCPDKVFILDKPMVSQDFIDNVNVPILWIDHHTPVKRKGVRYYNPRSDDKEDGRPVSYWCYKVTKKNLWIAMVGCIGDWFLPEFSKEFSEKYPDLLSEDIKDSSKAKYETRLGELDKIFSFILKGKTSDVTKCMNILSRIKDPYEILEQKTSRGKFLFKKAEWVNKKYQELLEKALKVKSSGKLFLFVYPSGKMSFTGDLSNELLYRFPDKVILIAREKNGEMRLSLRSKDILLPPIIKKALIGLEGYGGGHYFAVGANVTKKDFKKFVETVEKEINQK